MAVVDNALANGYSIEWATDVSEKGFDRIKAIGIIPETDIDGMEGTEAEKWGKLSAAEKEAALYKFDKPVKEKKITQEMRRFASTTTKLRTTRHGNRGYGRRSAGQSLLQGKELVGRTFLPTTVTTTSRVRSWSTKPCRSW